MSSILLAEIIIGLFVIGILFVGLQHVATDIVFEFGQNLTVNETAKESITFLQNVWIVIPIILTLAVLYYGIAQAQRPAGELR